jgi:hypothetical protein
VKGKILLLVLVCFLGTSNIIGAAANRNFEQEVFRAFDKALFHNDHQRLNTLKEPHVKLPEIREKTPLGGLGTLPSPRKNTLILMGHFFEDGQAERIAFIWEITWKDHKISHIKVVSDVANPLMNELIVTKEYREKFNKEILVPSYFPFHITHVEGKVTGKELSIEYKNMKMAGVLEITAAPAVDVPKGYKPVVISDRKKGLIGNTPMGYKLVFSQEDLQYNVSLNGTNGKYKPTQTDLIKVVNSMFPKQAPWSDYPDNSAKKFKDAEAFYNSLDQWEYEEFKDSKLTIREKTPYKNVNSVLMRADDYAHFRVGSGNGRHPERQVYVFISVSEKGIPRAAIFDAETREKFLELGDW